MSLTNRPGVFFFCFCFFFFFSILSVYFCIFFFFFFFFFENVYALSYLLSFFPWQKIWKGSTFHFRMPNLRDPNLPAYSREEMDNALRKIKTGKSIRSVAKSCKIPRSTLYDYAFGKYKGHNVESVYKKTLSATDETALCNYITYMSDRGFPLTRKMISTLVVAIAKTSNRETQMNLEVPLKNG